MRIVWKILVGAGVTLALLVAAVVVLVLTVDASALLGPVRDRIKAATGRDLDVKGGIRFALSLEPKLVLKDVTLSNASWGSAPQMIAAERLELDFALMPLLHRRV